MENELSRVVDALSGLVWSAQDCERRFRLIVDGLPSFVTVLTPDGQPVYGNRQVREYFGTTLEALEGPATADTLHPGDRAAVLAAWEECLRSGQTYDSQGRQRRADGIYRWFHMRGFPLWDPEGRIVLWWLLQTDIDDQKRAEALLAGEKRLLEMVALDYPLPVILDALCRLVEDNVTGCYCSVVLIDPSGTHLKHGAAPSLPASFNESIQGRPVNLDSGPCAMAAYLHEQVISADIMSETRWEAYDWCPLALAHGLRACWSTPILSRAEKVLGTFAIYYREPRTPTTLDQNLIEQFTHIASIAIERAESEAALKRSEAFLAEAQHLNRTGSFLWRPSTDELTFSKETYRIYGFDDSEPLTVERVNARVHPDDLAMLMEQEARTRRGELIDVNFDMRLRFPDSSIKHVHVVSHGARDDSGNLEYTGAVQDITDRRRAQDALARLQSELAHVARVSTLGALTASIAHEVNQPLAGILTNAGTCLRMLGDDPPNLEGARETARRTIRDGRRASEVITRLRALFAKRETTTELVDLNEATREVIALLLSELQRNRVTLRAELAQNLPTVNGDRVQLQQVICNLLVNASHAMRDVDDRPRELIVRTERDEDERVRLMVRDVGVGFESQDAARLFEAFYTTKSGGMGIGLSVSRTIIEIHQGRLRAVRNDGPGATFSFSIPCRPEHASAPRGSDALHTDEECGMRPS